jgi:hypothetical protein
MSSSLEQHAVAKETAPESQKIQVGKKLGVEAWGAQEVSKFAGKSSMRALPGHIDFSEFELQKPGDTAAGKGLQKSHPTDQSGKSAAGVKPDSHGCPPETHPSGHSRPQHRPPENHAAKGSSARPDEPGKLPESVGIGHMKPEEMPPSRNLDARQTNHLLERLQHSKISDSVSQSLKKEQVETDSRGVQHVVPAH